MNTTANAHPRNDDVVAWIVVPTVLAVLLYLLVAMAVWPYARPIVPLSLLLLTLFLPPLLPFLIVYLLLLACLAPVAVRPIVGLPIASIARNDATRTFRV